MKSTKIRVIMNYSHERGIIDLSSEWISNEILSEPLQYNLG